MVAPLTQKVTFFHDSESHQHYSYGVVQKPPYNIATGCYIERNWGTGTDGRSWNWGPGAIPGSIEQRVTNAAYAGFVNQLGETSSFGATLTAELKETLGMVTSTVIKLATAANKIKRLDFRGAAQTLGLPYSERTISKSHRRRVRGPGGKRKFKTWVTRRRVFTLPSGREVQKTLASGWLMWSYGVKPLASDIYNGLDALQRPWHENRRIRAFRREAFNFASTAYEWGYAKYRTKSGTVRIGVGAIVSVENPWTFLANQMGLTNPVQWALEAIPFSFVVDWFSNLSQVVMSFTDFVGLKISSPWTCKLYECKETQTSQNPYDFTWSKSKAIFQRILEIAPPKLVFAYERFEVARALNAISLLIGFLPKSR